jgi:hypothetical protein
MDQFVIRLWAPAPSPGDSPDVEPGLRGVVSHVGTGRSETFRDGRELLRRLIDLRAPLALDRRPAMPVEP